MVRTEAIRGWHFGEWENWYVMKRVLVYAGIERKRASE